MYALGNAMGRVIANSGGITHVHSAVDVHVVLEVAVIQSHPGIIAHKKRIAGIDDSIRVHVTPKEPNLDATSTSDAPVRAGNPGGRYRKNLLIGYARERNDHVVAAKADVTNVSSANGDIVVAVCSVVGDAGAAAVHWRVESQDDGVITGAIAPTFHA
jgi:hypothetical protein